MVDIRTEDDIELLRQVAVLQDAEIAKLHERIGLLSAENEKLRKQKQGRLQRELEAVKNHLEKLQKMQFGASSEKRKRDEKKQSDNKKSRKERSRSGPTPQPDLDKQEEWFELDEPDQVCPECGDPLEEMGDCAEESGPLPSSSCPTSIKSGKISSGIYCDPTPDVGLIMRPAHI